MCFKKSDNIAWSRIKIEASVFLLKKKNLCFFMEN
jgi:hypothetical protein